ncbi:YodC family protein [Aeromonas enteropelogenes]|uniref:YodC family protein n=1 Tax=Aeromonas enteropelogenes TaxID=29489 RepID=UPI003B9ED03B
MADIRVGEVVRLKSGGPLMTVTAQTYDGNWECRWFVDGKESSAVFPSEALHSKAEADAIDLKATLC